MIIDVVIPAYDEEGTVAKVVGDIDMNLVRQVVVVDNNSTDKTAQVAKDAGALVVKEVQRGYGKACLTGLDVCRNSKPTPDVVVFMDADYSDHPEQLIDLVGPVVSGQCDMVIGSRALGNREKGSMAPQQRFGNWLATFLIRLIYKERFTDLGPFRAIRWTTLEAIGMKDENFGWTVEMQIKVIKGGFRFREVPVDYRQRGAGKSKVAGTFKGTVLAGWKIISTILKYS